MLSYRHAFHAGNHADVLKHLIEVQLLRYLGQKDKPFWYIDTHAGAGAYSLDAGYASKLAEHADGIARLWGRRDLPPALLDYLGLVEALNDGGRLSLYPGSPWLARQLLRAQDRMRLFELHSSDGPLLAQNFRDLPQQAQVVLGDGFRGLKALLPPPPRRALVLIDPSYETAADYSAVLQALEEGLKRFPNGTYALWYPQLARPEARALPDKLKRLPAAKWLCASLSVRGPASGPGMWGSGMFVINPPWTLQACLRECLPCLARELAQGEGGGFKLESGGD